MKFSEQVFIYKISSKKLSIIFGISVYDSFYDADTTGIVPMPDITNETLQGGNCILVVGYNNATQRFTCVNSW